MGISIELGMARTDTFIVCLLLSLLPSTNCFAQDSTKPKMTGNDAAIAAQAAVQKGDYDTAIDMFMKASASDDLTIAQKAIALDDCAIILERQQKTAEALKAYSSAIIMNPEYAGAYYARANLEALNLQSDAAIADYTAAIKLAPRQANYYFSRGVEYGHRGERDLAINDETAAIAQNIAFPEAFNARDSMYLEKNDMAQATSDYSAAIHLRPGYAEAYANRAFGYRVGHQYKESIADYDRAIELQPDTARFYVNRGIAWFDLGSFDGAAKTFAAYRALAPNDICGVLWMHATNLRLKVDDSKEMTAIAPLFDVKGWTQSVLDLYLGRTNEDHVVAVLHDPASSDAGNPVCTAPFYVGEYELARGNVERARALFQQTASTACLNGEVEAAAEELARLPK